MAAAVTLVTASGGVGDANVEVGTEENPLIVSTASGGPASDVVATGNVASGVADSGNPVKVGGVFNTTGLSALTSGQRGDAQIDSNGNLFIRIIGASVGSTDGLSSSIVYATDTARNQNRPFAHAGHKWNGNSWDRDRKANTVARLTSSAASNNATAVKTSPGGVYFIAGNNTNAAIRYLKLFNQTATPVPGTHVPFMTFALPPLSAFNISFGGEIYFSAGIGYALVTGAGDADNTAVAAGDILGLNIAYI